MTDDEIPTLGIVASWELSPNEEAILYHWGRMLVEEFQLELVTNVSSVPERLKPFYRFHRPSIAPNEPTDLIYGTMATLSYLSQCAPDVVIHTCKQQTLGLGTVAICRLAGVPVVVRMTGDVFSQVSLARTRWERIKRSILYDLLAPQAFRFADRVVTLTPRHFENLRGCGVSQEQRLALPQPFEPNDFEPVDEETRRKLRRRLGLRLDARVILFVGRVEWLKGADRLVESIERTTEAGYDAQFCVVGPIREAKWEEKLKSVPAEFVHLAGEVPHDDVSQYYRAADALMLPTRTEGGAPNVLLEALACRLPVVASPVGAIPDYVNRLAETPAAFVDALFEPQLTPDPVPDWFDWERQTKNYRSLFRSLLQEET